jgi:hypothetical protein
MLKKSRSYFFVCPRSRRSVGTWSWFLFVAALALSLALPFGCQVEAGSFDPWYFQTDRDVRFLVPDKAQHFYGSQLLASRLGPASALLAGVAWELVEAASGGFVSGRDLAADALGVLASRLGPGRLVVVWRKEPAEIRILVSLPWRAL